MNTAMNERVLNYKGLILTVVCLSIIGAFYSNEAVAFTEPIVNKAREAEQQLIMLGKALGSIALVVTVIMIALGRPQWKWSGLLVVAGILLSTFPTLKAWVGLI